MYRDAKHIKKKKDTQESKDTQELKNVQELKNAEEIKNAQNALGENKMGIMPIDRLIISMSLPIMLSMLVHALYNVVDSIFVSRINEFALRAVSLVFPIQVLMTAVGVGTAVGINSVLAKTLGEGDVKKANRIAENGVFLAAISYIAFAVLGLAVSRGFMASQTDIRQVQDYGVTYLTICCVGSIGVFMQVTFERLLQATGKTIYTMFTHGLGAVINLILDPILIFGWFGLPEMGVAGAALATVIGQLTAGTMAIVLNHMKNHEICLKVRGFRPDAGVIRQIYRIGLPSIVVQAIGSVMTYGMNLILAGFGVAQTVFGVYFKLQSFIFMPVFGLNSGLISIVAYNYGAKKEKRVRAAIRSGIRFGVIIMATGTLILQLFPEQLLRLFEAEGEMLELGKAALRTFSLSFVMAGFGIVASGVFQAMGRATYSMTVSIARQLCVLLPVAYLLSLTGQASLVWWSLPIAELVSMCVSLLFMRSIYKHVISKLGDAKA